MQDSLVASIFVFAGLILTQYPSVPGGDAGELIAESCLLGNAHPPGYPIFIMISNVSIRIGNFVMFLVKYLFSNQENDNIKTFREELSPARCVNSLCCLFGAMACYYLSESIRLHLSTIEGSRKEHTSCSKVVSSVCGAIGGILFSLSPLTWEYSRMAEVFALNNFLVSLIIYHTIQIDILVAKDQEFDIIMRWSMRGAFISGLAMSNQHTSLLYIVPIIPYVLHSLYRMSPAEKKTIAILSATLKLAFCFIVGLLPYLYLGFASQIPSPGSWGNLTTFAGSLRHVLREEYGSLSLAAGKFTDVEGSLIRWAAYIVNAFKQFSASGMFLSFYGMVHSVRNSSRSGSGILLIFLLMHYLLWWNGVFSNLPLSNSMSYEVQSRFYMQPNIIICFYTGIGCFRFLFGVWHDQGKFFMRIISRFTFASILVWTVSREHMMTSWKEPSRGMIIHDYATAVLSSLPENSLLLSYSDLNWNSVRYLQTCEDKRKDITHLSLQLVPYTWFEEQQSQLYSNVIFPQIQADVSTDKQSPGYHDFLISLLKANIDNDAFEGGIYIEMQSILNTDIQTGGIYKNELTLLPWGMVYRVLPKSNSNDKTFTHLRTKWQPKSLSTRSKVREVMKDHISSKVNEGSWEFAAISVYWDMYYQLGLHILGIALTLPTAVQKDIKILPKYIQSLRISSKLLSQVSKANDNHKGIVNQNEKDLIKNTALSQMRYNEAIKLHEKFKSQIPSPIKISSKEIEDTRKSTISAVWKYVDNFYRNEDETFSVFYDYYENMISDE